MAPRHKGGSGFAASGIGLTVCSDRFLYFQSALFEKPMDGATNQGQAATTVRSGCLFVSVASGCGETTNYMILWWKWTTIFVRAFRAGAALFLFISCIPINLRHRGASLSSRVT